MFDFRPPFFKVMWLFMPIDRMIYIHGTPRVCVCVFIIRTGLREKWIVERHLSFSGFQFTESLVCGWMDGWMDLARAAVAAPAPALYT